MSPKREGMTLLELVLVLAILAAIAGVVLPSYIGAMDNQRLRRSADSVRTAFVKARVKAMKTGRVQMFRFEIGGESYIIEPFITQDDYIESNDVVMMGGGASGGLGASASSLGGGVNSSSSMNQQGLLNQQAPPKTLAEGVVFVTGAAESDLRRIEIDAVLGDSASALGDWSAPVLFYPDGVTSTARVTLGGRHDRYIHIELRGLTGTTRASDIVSSSEALR